MIKLPKKFIDRLTEMYPDHLDQIISTFHKKPVVIRINHDVKTTVTLLEEHNAKLTPIPIIESIFKIENITAQELTKLPIYNQGHFYIQSLSSLIIPLVLDPQSGEKVLDLCSAPGSKTTQIAHLMSCQGELIANELDSDRIKRLSQVLKLQNCDQFVKLIHGPGQKLPDKYLNYFDRVLADVPCSAESRFELETPRTINHWKKHRIRSFYAKYQKQLIAAAFRYLKPGGTMVYSTCTMSPEENEAIVNYLLRKESRAQISKMSLPHIDQLPSITSWHGVTYHPDISKTYRIMPTELLQSFFIAKITKVS
jgi:tRNA (cytosine49-C5)-methyltransferase